MNKLVVLNSVIRKKHKIQHTVIVILLFVDVYDINRGQKNNNCIVCKVFRLDCFYALDVYCYGAEINYSVE